MTVFRPVCQKHRRFGGEEDGRARDEAAARNQASACTFHHKMAPNPTSCNSDPDGADLESVFTHPQLFQPATHSRLIPGSRRLFRSRARGSSPPRFRLPPSGPETRGPGRLARLSRLPVRTCPRLLRLHHLSSCFQAPNVTGRSRNMQMCT